MSMQLNTSRRLILGFGVLIVIFFLFGVFALYDIQRLTGLNRSIYNHPLVVSNAALQANVSITKMHRNMKDVVLFHTTSKIHKSIEDVRNEEDQVYRQLDFVRENILGKEGKALERAARKLFDQWRPIRNEVIRLVNANKRARAAEITIGNGADHVNLLEVKMLGIANYARSKASEFNLQAENIRSILNVVLIIFLGLGIIVSILVAFFTLKRTLSAEKALVKNESRYRALFDFNPIQTIVVDNDAKITMVNFTAERTSGKVPNPGDIMYRDYAAKHEIDMYEELITCIHKKSKKIFSGVKYKERFLNIQITPFTDGAMITSENITERKKLQHLLEQTRKMETVGTMSGGIAHEFNNILGIILGNIELSMDDVPEWNPTYDFLLEAKNASMRGKEIVSQLLSFSHKSENKMQPLDLASVIKESIKFLKASIPSSIVFDEKISDDCKAIMGNKTQIHQMMINLSNNAAQSMEDMAGKITITLKEKAINRQLIFAGQKIEPGGFILLKITDTGHGIKPGIIETIFDPFFTTKDVDKGTGLGLAVVYGIMKSHDGLIRIESTPVEGTTVFCYFPLINAVPVEAEKKTDALHRGKETILLVDDEASLLNTEKQILERLGYTVEAYRNPYESLDQFKANPSKYDLVLTDMTMPQMNGDQLIRELKSIKKNIKTIICTGYNKRIDTQKASELGASGYIMKPINRELLARTVREVLNDIKALNSL